MHKALTSLVVERYERTGEFDFPTSTFAAGGIRDRRGLDRNKGKLTRLYDRIRREGYPLGDSSDALGNLEILSDYFQARTASRGTIYLPQKTLDLLLSNNDIIEADTLPLTALFNLVAETAGILSMQALDCNNHYLPIEANYGLSFPVVRTTEQKHRSLMGQKKRVSNAGIVAAIADRAAQFYDGNGEEPKGRRLKRYSQFFEGVDVDCLR
jgi:hypothetical protein